MVSTRALCLYILFLVFLCFAIIILAGCVTMAKNVYHDNFASTPIPTTIPPTPEPIATPILTPIMTPTPLPTPDPVIAFKMQGGYNMSEWFHFTRKAYRDRVTIDVTAYRYQLRSQYHLNDDPKTLVLPKKGNNFLFVWVKVISSSTTSIGGYDHRSFRIRFRGATYNPGLEVQPIRELMIYSDLLHQFRTGPIGYEWGKVYESKDTAGDMEFIELPYMDPGQSNAWDGYLLFEVPRAAIPEELVLMGDFDNMFHARWQFIGGDKFSLARPPV